MIYFIERPDNRWIKIGTTTWLSRRLKALAYELELDLKVLGIIDGSYADEAELHRRFADLRIGGEWFAPGKDLTDFIASECREWDESHDSLYKQVKFDRILLSRAKLIAEHRDITTCELLSELLHGPINQAYLKIIRETESRSGDE